MLRKTILLIAGLGLASAAAAGDLIDNGSFEDGLNDWSQASTDLPGANFQSVPNGGSHTEDPGCVAPPGFPGSGSFWAVSCQGGESMHALYQDFRVPTEGGFLQMVLGVDMCSVAGGACDPTKAWGGAETTTGAAGSLWADKGFVFPVCTPPPPPPPKADFRGDSGSASKGPGGDDCVYVDFTDPAADVLDESAFLQRLGGAVNIDAPISQSPVFDLGAYAGQTIRLRIWVQAESAPVAAQVDTVDAQGRYTIPALQPLGLALLALVLGGVGLVVRRRMRRA